MSDPGDEDNRPITDAEHRAMVIEADRSKRRDWSAATPTRAWRNMLDAFTDEGSPRRLPPITDTGRAPGKD